MPPLPQIITFPGAGVFIQDKLEMGTTPALDIRNQCSGFLYALSVSKAFIESGQYQRILLSTSETHSRGIDFSDAGRDISVLFGDGAGAVILERGEDDSRGLKSVHLYSEGKHRDRLKMEYPSMLHKPFINQEMLDKNLIWPVMDGRYVFKNAVRRLLEVVHEGLGANNLTPDDVDHFVFHQANLRINEATLKELKQPAEKAYNNIQKYGNCSASSIPICLAECDAAGRYKPGDIICTASFGAGFTWGCAILKW